MTKLGSQKVYNFLLKETGAAIINYSRRAYFVIIFLINVLFFSYKKMVQLQNIKVRKSPKHAQFYACEDWYFTVSDTMENGTSIVSIFVKKDKDELKIQEVRQNLLQAEANLDACPANNQELKEEYAKAVRDLSSTLEFLCQDYYRWKKYQLVLDNDKAFDKLLRVLDEETEDSIRAKSKAAGRPYENRSTGEVVAVEGNFPWYWRNGD